MNTDIMNLTRLRSTKSLSITSKCLKKTIKIEYKNRSNEHQNSEEIKFKNEDLMNDGFQRRLGEV